MSKQERRYCITRKELLAVIQSVKHFHHYLYGTHFLIRTDHAALKWLTSFKHPEGQIARWLEILGTYNFEIAHRPGRSHGNADGLSRRSCPEECQHCTRAEVGETERSGPMELRPKIWKKEGETKRLTEISYGEVEVKDSAAGAPEVVAAVTASTDQDSPWLQKWTNETIPAEQVKDEAIRKILEWKESRDKRPVWEEVSPESKEVKAYWAQWHRLELKNSLLCRRWENNEGDKVTWQLVVPRSLQAKSLHCCTITPRLDTLE
ncbi:Retrovirus-related Pol polyprotein from transposon [Apostichopus japonicus]|uniref:Retrovirus-related Pol polyprotein from transposon n=1 Tax=Stichopus japonicus TaxID=307972 RepID=A0A2G8KE29_STIJA|nr:Retrovirus-related Pol polyprotein from transposon [Apostichopus japonicus]